MKKQSPSPFPRSLTWLVSELSLAYHDKLIVLALIGDFARLVRKRRKEKRGLSNTTCISCGGWISKEREVLRQHTCSVQCQDWYRRLTRAIDAAKYCRYCGHGYPKERQKSVRTHRPARVRGRRQATDRDAINRPGAARQGYRIHRPTITPGTLLRLIPNKREGVDREAVAEAIEKA